MKEKKAQDSTDKQEIKQKKSLFWFKKRTLREKLFNKKKQRVLDAEMPEGRLLILERENNDWDIYDNIVTGRFDFVHSNGETRYLEIAGKPKKIPLHDDVIEAYYHHENHPFQIPEDPVFTTEQYTITKEKDIHDAVRMKNSLKARKMREYIELAKQIAIGVALLVGALAVSSYVFEFNLFEQLGRKAVETAPAVVQTTKPVVEEIAKNISEVTILN